jgi:hypothetical protein
MLEQHASALVGFDREPLAGHSLAEDIADDRSAVASDLWAFAIVERELAEVVVAAGMACILAVAEPDARIVELVVRAVYESFDEVTELALVPESVECKRFVVDSCTDMAALVAVHIAALVVVRTGSFLVVEHL